MKTSVLRLFLAVSAWALGPACAQGPGQGAQRGGEGEMTGSIQLGLDVAPGSSLSQATYTITGPGNYLRSVTVTLGNAPKLSTFIGGTPPGTGYLLSVTGIANDGVSVCSGVSAPFDVVGGRTTVVSLVLRCQKPEATGSIQTNGSLNYCAAVDSLMANPGEAPVGGTIALNSGTHDKDNGPSPITFTWTASSGIIYSSGAGSTTFTCTSLGSATITLTVKDGDCGDSRSVSVTCSAGAAPPTAPADAGVDAVTLADAAPPFSPPPQDPCLICESRSPEPACATRYNLCVSLADLAKGGPAVGTPKKNLCVDLFACVHATRCDAGARLRDCFCGSWIDDLTCKTNPMGACREAFWAAAETTSNAAVLARLRDPNYALGVGAALIEECEHKPAPLCGPSCGH